MVEELMNQRVARRSFFWLGRFGMKVLGWLTITTILLVASVSTGTSFAETDLATSVKEKAAAAVVKLQSACGQDVRNYCSSVTPAEGRLILCMEAHDDKL